VIKNAQAITYFGPPADGQRENGVDNGLAENESPSDDQFRSASWRRGKGIILVFWKSKCPGDDLLSLQVTPQVPSALVAFTTLFGMVLLRSSPRFGLRKGNPSEAPCEARSEGGEGVVHYR